MSNQPQAPATQAVEKPQKPKQTLAELLAHPDVQAKIAKALPKFMTPDAFMRVAFNTINRDSKLAQCDSRTVIQCFYELAVLGLMADGIRSYLIPFRNNAQNRMDCKVMVSYKGILELVRRTGEVSVILANVVHQNDHFDYMMGSKTFLEHKPALGNRGAVTAVYCYVRLKDGSEIFDIMDPEAVEAVRKRSQSARSGPWVTDWEEMAKKTVFRRLGKWLPISYELREVMEKDDKEEPLTQNERFISAKPVFEDQPAPVQIPAQAEYAPDTMLEAQAEEPRDYVMAEPEPMSHSVKSKFKKANQAPEPAPVVEAKPEPPSPPSVYDDFAKILTEHFVTFTLFKDIARKEQWIPQDLAVDVLENIPQQILRGLIRNKVGFIATLQKYIESDGGGENPELMPVTP